LVEQATSWRLASYAIRACSKSCGEPGKLRVQPPVGFVDRLGGRPGNGGSGLVGRLSLGFAQEQVAGVNAASARAQFAALFDSLIKEDVWRRSPDRS
jgi:hypothetical protein